MVSRGRVRIVAPGDDPPQVQGSAQMRRLEPYGELTVYTERPNSFEEKVRRAFEADVILNSRGAVTWDAEALRKLPRLRMITTCGVGTDSIDLETASDLGIVVSNQPGRTAPVVAEHMIGLLFAAAKRAHYQTAQIKAGNWGRMDNVFLRGKTLGIVGTGNIGAEMARIASALGMEVIAWTFNPSRERAEKIGVRYVELEDLLGQSDAVSLHVALTDDTRGMIGAREFALMKDGAIFVNGGRGPLVDELALADALNSGKLHGAALDVFEQEPPPADHPLLKCEQVVFTPHMADMTPEGVEMLNEGAVDNIIAFLEGRPQNVVT
jgi:phosphoglycerate dehydrogenase-like enzyme